LIMQPGALINQRIAIRRF